MPVQFIPSGDGAGGQTTARKRRRNQNTEIEELASLLPVKQPAVIGEGVLARGRTGGLDKISVLRLATGYLKLQNYLHTSSKSPDSPAPVASGVTAAPVASGVTAGPVASGVTAGPVASGVTPGPVASGVTPGPVASGVTADLMSEALDGFVMVLDREATVLYTSEAIARVAGLSQHDVIGQNLADITDEGDAPVISKALIPETTPPSIHLDGRTELQSRQFFIRIKSSLTPGKLQLSRFKSHIMLQVSGSLKVHVPFQSHMIPAAGHMTPATNSGEPVVLGFVGECRPIESSSSILEVSVPQSHFTTTINLDMKIISVEASITEVVGYNPADVIGTRMSDYFHPGDCKDMIPCEKQLLRLGHAVSPVFRFMSSSGEWVWMQLEGILRFKPDGKNPQFWEVKAKLMSQEDGRMKFIQYREMYAKSCDPNQEMLSPHRDPAVTACLLDVENRIRMEGGAEPIIDSLRQAQVPSSLIDPVLHCRELGLDLLPGKLKRALTENDADDFVIERNKRFGWPIPKNLQNRAKYIEDKRLSMSTGQQNGVQSQGVGGDSPISSPPLSNASEQQNVYPQGGSVLSATHSPASQPSPIGSGLDQFSPQDSIQSYTNITTPPSVTSDPEKGNVLSPPSVTSDPATQPPTGYDFTPYAQPQLIAPQPSPQTPALTAPNSSASDDNCLGSLLSNGTMSHDEVFQLTEGSSLESILSDMIALNQAPNKISVDCDVQLSETRGYIDSGIGVDADADELIQQFLSS